MATGWRKTVVPLYQDTQVWDGCSDCNITLFTMGLFGAHILVPALRCALGTPLTPLIAHLGRLQVLPSAPFTSGTFSVSTTGPSGTVYVLLWTPPSLWLD